MEDTLNKTPESIGAAAPIFLTLALLLWLAMLASIWLWLPKTPVPGRESDRLIEQLYSGILALLVWISLAAVLLIVASKRDIPAGLGAIEWIAHPVSLIATLAAILVLYDPAPRWPLAIPIVSPLLIAGFAIYSLFPVQPARGAQINTMPVATAGYLAWAIIIVLSIFVAPTAIRFMRLHGDSGSISADAPQAELEAWNAKQRERRRQSELEELSKSDDETHLYELAHLIRPDSPTLQEALEFMRHLPNRQSEAVMMLQSQQSSVMDFLGDIDLEPTPELCSAARGYLQGAVRQRMSMSGNTGNDFVGIEFENAIPSIRWISKNCGCLKELDAMEAYAKLQQQDAPKVKKFLEEIDGMRKEAAMRREPAEGKKPNGDAAPAAK